MWWTTPSPRQKVSAKGSEEVVISTAATRGWRPYLFQLQRDLLPGQLPLVPGLSVCAMNFDEFHDRPLREWRSSLRFENRTPRPNPDIRPQNPIVRLSAFEKLLIRPNFRHSRRLCDWSRRFAKDVRALLAFHKSQSTGCRNSQLQRQPSFDIFKNGQLFECAATQSVLMVGRAQPRRSTNCCCPLCWSVSRTVLTPT